MLSEVTIGRCMSPEPVEPLTLLLFTDGYSTVFILIKYDMVDGS